MDRDKAGAAARSNSAPGGDRRKDFRFTTLLRVGLIEIGSRRELCLVRNISARGLMAEVFSEVRPDDRATVELKTGNRASGTVTWVNGRQIGFTFDEPAEIRELLALPPGGGQGHRVRLPRIEVATQALLRFAGGLMGAQVIDISQGGVKIAGRLSYGETVQVSMDGLPPLRGVVRWCDGDQAGIAFLGLIPFRQLVSWASEHQGGREAACDTEPLRDSA